MIQTELTAPDAATAAAEVEASHRLICEQECRLLELAAHWADLHHPDSVPAAERLLPGREQGRWWGGEGTPPVLEFAPAELGVRLETTLGAARAMIADALDLRHRFPILWQRILGGRVRAWRARKVAQATRHLDAVAAGLVDRAVAHLIITLPWARFETLLAAKIIEADPAGAELQAKLWEAERFVRASTTRRSGLKLMVAQADAGDVIMFLATVNRIAEILQLRGDQDSADVRRSKAIGILAQPALALQLLWDHRDEQHPGPPAPDADDPVTNEPDAPPDLSDAWDPPDDSAESDEQTAGGLTVIEPPIDPSRCKPKVVLYLHLSQEAVEEYLGGNACPRAVGRFEGVGPVTLEQIRRFLGRTACDLRIQPVIDLSEDPAADSYEIPQRLREMMFLRLPGGMFPWSPGVNRGSDLDHTIPYVKPDRGGSPGQTRVGNLGPGRRTEHRIKTHGGWQFRQPAAGVFVCRSRYGNFYLVTNAGTQSLGSGWFAHAVWQASERPIGG